MDLLSCPECGNQPKLSSLEPEYQTMKYFCSVHCSIGDWKPTKELAAADWNRRVREYEEAVERSESMSEQRDLRADLEICEKATPGPWEVKNESEGSGFFDVVCPDGKGIAPTGCRQNALFIAAARTGWPEAIERAIKAEERVLALESSMQMFKDMCENSPTQELDEQYYKEKIAALREENEKLKNELGSVKYIRDKYQGELVAKEILDDEFENGELVKLLAVVEAAEELLEVANLRGDNELPHPADDPKLWTARAQTAWDELAQSLAAAGYGGEE